MDRWVEVLGIEEAVDFVELDPLQRIARVEMLIQVSEKDRQRQTIRHGDHPSVCVVEELYMGSLTPEPWILQSDDSSLKKYTASEYLSNALSEGDGEERKREGYAKIFFWIVYTNL